MQTKELAGETAADLTTSPNILQIKASILDGEMETANTIIGIPKRYQGKKIKDNKYIQQAVEAIQTGNSIFLTGAAGCGKTHLAIYCLLQYAADKIVIGYYNLPYQPNGWVKFISMPELKLTIKKSWNSKDDFHVETEEDIIDKYSLTPLLALDDLGAEKISDWSKEVLYLIIDRRYRNCKQTIITSNLSLRDISEKIDERIASRICEMGIVIDMGNIDFRLKSKNA